MVVSTNVKNVKITYLDHSKDLTLVVKDINLANNSLGEILEVIPKDVIDSASSIDFITDVEIIKDDPMVSVNKEDLIDGKFIYFVDGFIDPKSFDKCDTLLFHEFNLENIGVTGFFVFDSVDFDSSIYLILLIFAFIVVLYLFYCFYLRVRIYFWKKEEDVVRIFRLIRQCKRAVKRRDLSVAKEKYHLARSLYPLIPRSCKKFVYKDLKKIRVAIDKKEIFDLVREYESCIKESRVSDSRILYSRISSVYKRLPGKYRERVYSRIFKRSV